MFSVDQIVHMRRRTHRGVVTIEQFDVADISDVKRGKGERIAVDADIASIPFVVLRVLSDTLYVQDEASGIIAIARKSDIAN